jgi:type I restriction enzyme S subunit
MTKSQSTNPDITDSLLSEHFATLATAPEGIARLRDLILQLAVQGKLGTQDEGDEPALKLVERIRNEKDLLVKEGKLKSGKPLEKTNVAPYNVPDGWQWCQLGEISEIIMGNSPPGDTYNIYGDGVPLINGPTEFSKNPLGKTIVSQYTTQPTKFCKENDLLICVRGATTGRTNIAGFDACVGRGVAVIRSPLIQSYLNLIILTKAQQILDMGTGSTFPSISQNDLLTLLVPLPPLAEQHRIVAKVDRLMALCDELEARQQQERAGCLKLSTASLAGLQNATHPEEFERLWAQVCDSFDLLLDCPENVVLLRQTILDLAIQGYLDCQNNEQNRSKTTVCSSQKKKVQSDIDISISIPEWWIYSNINDISLKITDGEHATPKRSYSGFPLLSARNIGNSSILLEDVDYVEEHEFLRIRKRCDPNKDDILISCSGSVGRVAICDKDNYYVMVRSAALIKPDKNRIDSRFLVYCLQSPFLQKQIKKKSRITAQANLFIGKIKELAIPLPPLTEQHRIIAKVDTLMAWCDALEARLKERAMVQGKLAGAIVKGITT